MYGYGQQACCGYGYPAQVGGVGGVGGYGCGFAIIVVLFILLIIVGASCFKF
jgi:uncharacterized protein (TIGR01732 family)